MNDNKKIKIALISPYQSMDLIGLRIISSYLKQHGHETQMIFLNLHDPSYATTYSEEVVKQVVDLCRDADLIGISLMTNYFVRAKDLTSRIKKHISIPIIWGGIHPTVRPEECIKYADMICIGEGEDAMLELADKLKTGNITDIKNIWLKEDGVIIKNELRPIEQDLDKYPFPDYDLRNHYILEGDMLVRMTDKHMEKAMRRSDGSRKKPLREYMLLTTRNCPHNCTYCCNNALRKILGKSAFLVRKRSIDKVIEELEQFKKRFEFVESVAIMDETFFVRSRAEIEDFSEKYKNKIALPMACLVSPFEIDEDKLASMTQSGLYFVWVGIQSFNQHTLYDLYKRKTPRELILRAVKILDKFKAKMPHPQYLFIIDNPFETKESLRETLGFITSLPENAIIVLFPLVFFPGTELYDRAKRSGLIDDEIKEIYLKDFTKEYVAKLDLTTRMLYFQHEIRIKNAFEESVACRMILKCRQTVLIYFFFALHEMYGMIRGFLKKHIKQILNLLRFQYEHK